MATGREELVAPAALPRAPPTALPARAGLACREDGAWRIPVLAQAVRQDTAYRQAGAALPAAVLDAVDARITGATLDAAAERKARDGGWQASAAHGKTVP